MANIKDSKLNIPTKKVVTVWGTPGSGKSSFAVQIALLIAQTKKLKVIILDFDTLYPSLDHYFGISKEPENITYKINEQDSEICNTSLSYAYDAIERGIFNTKVLQEVVVTHPEYKNLNILTGNYRLNMFEMLKEKHFNEIIEAAKKVYDIIIIDTNSVVFVDATYVSLKESDLIFAVTEADYTSIREINKTLSYISSYIPKSKLNIIINKYTNKHIDKITVSQALESLNVLKVIDYYDKHIKSKINKKPFIFNCKDKEKKAYLEIVNSIIDKH